METDMQYLYSDGSQWHFMNNDSFEQVAADETAMSEAQKWIKEEDTCTVTLWNGSPISVSPPNFVNLKVSETDPGLRGDTSGGGNKPATLETGAVVKCLYSSTLAMSLRLTHALVSMSRAAKTNAARTASAVAVPQPVS